MNLSSTMTQIKLNLGLAAFSSPFLDINQTINDIIRDYTVPIFSTYAPYKETIRLSTTDMKLDEKHDNYRLYILPKNIADKLVYIFTVLYDDTSISGLGYYGTVMPTANGYDARSMIMANATAQLSDQMIPKMTFKWEKPRKLYLYNSFTSVKLKIECGFRHDPSLVTIDDDMRESFMKLALLDVKMHLYPTFSQFTELNTAIGNINLKIVETWANAESERNELIDKWEDTYHLDLYDFDWF